jgi:hypothetical protein
MKRFTFIILLAAVFFVWGRLSFARTEASPNKTSSETRVEKMIRDSGASFDTSLEPSRPLVTIVPLEYSHRRCPRFDFVTKAKRLFEPERY